MISDMQTAASELLAFIYATRAGGEWVSTNGTVVTDDLGSGVVADE